MLVALLAIVVAAPVAVAGLGLAAWATALRWGTVWLGPIGGAQAVLGNGLVVGPPVATVSGVLAAAAIVLAAPAVSWLGAVAVGTSAAFVVAGPVGADGAAARVAGSVVCIALALGVSVAPWRRTLVVSAAIAGLGAVLLG